MEMFETIEANACFESGERLNAGSETIYAVTFFNEPGSLPISKKTLSRIPDDQRVHGEAGTFSGEGGLDVHRTIHLTGSTLEVDDIHCSLSAKTLLEYLPTVAREFGLTAAAST